jgi:hypothetical protein
VTEPVPAHGCMIDGQPAMPILISEYNRLVGDLAALRAVARGYCPDCGRGDAAPTADDWERERRRADQAEAERDDLARQLSESRSGEAILGQRVLHWVALASSHQHWGQRRWNAWKNARSRARNWRARAERAEAAVARVRAVHRPADDWSWQTFGCGHDDRHEQVCAYCRACYPCPTLTALDEPTPATLAGLPPEEAR